MAHKEQNEASAIKDLDDALIRSIQEITQFMAKKTIAEYSSNQSVWEILRSIGIDYMLLH